MRLLSAFFYTLLCPIIMLEGVVILRPYQAIYYFLHDRQGQKKTMNSLFSGNQEDENAIGDCRPNYLAVRNDLLKECFYASLLPLILGVMGNLFLRIGCLLRANFKSNQSR